MPSLSPDQVEKIHEYIHNQQLIHAIKLYREVTGVGLAEAKEAIEAMARDEAIKPPSDRMDYDDPVLEAKIRSLLERRQKIEAVKIYREEYGVGLKEAKDAVDRIEASMKRTGSSMSLPYEPAIGSDPFVENNSSNIRPKLILVVMLAIALFGVAVYFMAANF